MLYVFHAEIFTTWLWLLQKENLFSLFDRVSPYIGLFRVSDLHDPYVTGTKPQYTWRWVTGENSSSFQIWDAVFKQPDERAGENAAVMFRYLTTPGWNDVLPSNNAPYICENEASGRIQIGRIRMLQPTFTTLLVNWVASQNAL